jgi:hypothetical protein
VIRRSRPCAARRQRPKAGRRLLRTRAATGVGQGSFAGNGHPDDAGPRGPRREDIYRRSAGAGLCFTADIGLCTRAGFCGPKQPRGQARSCASAMARSSTPAPVYPGERIFTGDPQKPAEPPAPATAYLYPPASADPSSHGGWPASSRQQWPKNRRRPPWTHERTITGDPQEPA